MTAWRRRRACALWCLTALLAGGLALARPARSETWHVPDRPEITVSLPDGASWAPERKAPDEDSVLRVAAERVDRSKVVGVFVGRKPGAGVVPGQMTDGDADALEREALEGGMTMVDSARFMLDGNRALRIVTRGSIKGRDMMQALVLVIADGRLYGTRALATEGDPFDDPELAGFLLSLHMPPGDGSVRTVPAPGFSVVLPTGEDWIVETGGPAPKVRMVKALDHHGAITALKGDGAGPAGLDKAMVDGIDREMYGSGENRKRSGQLLYLASGDPAYFTVGTTDVNGTEITISQVYTVANGHLFGVQVAAKGNPLLDPVFNRALFSLSTE